MERINFMEVNRSLVGVNLRRILPLARWMLGPTVN